MTNQDAATILWDWLDDDNHGLVIPDSDWGWSLIAAMRKATHALESHDATIRTEQAERDAEIAEQRIEYHNWVPNNSEDNYDAGRVHEASDIAAAIRDAAKEER